MQNHFCWLDFVTVAVTILLTVIIGFYFSRKNKTNDDLLLGGRKINHWPVALSVMASYISAVTVIGFPAEIAGHGIEIFNMAIVEAICFPLGVAIFVPFLYSMNLTSLFDYLERRFQCSTLRKLVCGIYIIEQIALAGVILYGPSLVLVTFLGIPPWMSIFGIGIFCTLYTCVGGIKAVVWTDALQGIIMIIGMLAIMVKAFMNSGGISNAFQIAKDNGRLHLFNMNFDIFQRHNFYNFYIGFAFMAFVRSAIHQQQVQRFTSQPTLKDAKKAMNLSIPITLTVKVIGLLTGIAILAIYVNCDPVLLGKIKKIDHLVPYFVVSEMSQIPGILGLFTACIFSGVLSSISSALNSMTAVTWEDFLSPIPVFAKMDAKSQANVTRLTGLVYGVLSVALAFSAQYMGSVYAASYQVIGASIGVVAATFLSGFFMRYINAAGAKVGAIVGYITMLTLGLRSLFSNVLKEPLLPTGVSNCAADQLTSFANSTLSIQQNGAVFTVEWPEKIFTISYLMLSVIGAILTLIVAAGVSFCSGGFRNQDFFPEEYLHPIVRRKQEKTTTILQMT